MDGVYLSNGESEGATVYEQGDSRLIKLDYIMGVTWVVQRISDSEVLYSQAPGTPGVPSPWLVEEWQAESAPGPNPIIWQQASSDTADVSAAGSVEFNGSYKRSINVNGYPSWLRSGVGRVQWVGTRWGIVSVGSGSLMYFEDQPGPRLVMLPWLVQTWLADAGDSPAPSVTQLPG